MRLSKTVQRIFDIVLSLTGLIISIPFFFVAVIFIVVTDGYPVFFIQKRVGLNGREFGMFKFRSMKKNAEKIGLQITVGGKDPRITQIGFILRKYKIDELPQLFNVLIGQMSFVGPRPEVRRYVNEYTDAQLEVLKIKPGITDLASIKYKNENELLGKSINPEHTYINEVLPAKIELNMKFVKNPTIQLYFQIIWKTIF
jgi:lipopolysaccharide/colanic/teichoic acid biosynthesis glycosyltransferase